MKKLVVALSIAVVFPAIAQEDGVFKIDDVNLKAIKFNEFVAQAKDSNTWIKNKKLANESTVSCRVWVGKPYIR